MRQEVRTDRTATSSDSKAYRACSTKKSVLGLAHASDMTCRLHSSTCEQDIARFKPVSRKFLSFAGRYLGKDRVIDLSIADRFSRNYGDSFLDVVMSVQLRAERPGLKFNNSCIAEFSDRATSPLNRHTQAPSGWQRWQRPALRLRSAAVAGSWRAASSFLRTVRRRPRPFPRRRSVPA